MRSIVVLFVAGWAVLGCRASQASSLAPLRAHALAFAEQQLTVTVGEVATNRFPRSTLSNGAWWIRQADDWTSGFFPGCLWLMAEYTGSATWTQRARTWTASLNGEQNNTSTHDVGFKILCSYGNGYRISGDPAYPNVIRTGAQSLATRYSSIVGCTRSWDSHDYTFPVIIDNMMNLEILFWGAAHGGSPTWRDMAISHGLRTRVEHLRSDASTYHLVDFVPATGAVASRITVQGYAHESTWARGQAWALYGFAMTYRETQDPRFLETAMALADWFIAHLPADHVPYWDFDAPAVPDRPRDSSAAAIAASGLLELATQAGDAAARTRYFVAASEILTSLCAAPYLAEGSNSHGILLHGTGDKPHHSEIDVSLIYGDYYFLEALLRSRAVESDVGGTLQRPAVVLTAAPNPARGALRVALRLERAEPVEVHIVDVGGHRIRRLYDGDWRAGTGDLRWDGRRDDGTRAPSGTYFVILRAGDQTRTCKVAWLR